MRDKVRSHTVTSKVSRTSSAEQSTKYPSFKNRKKGYSSGRKSLFSNNTLCISLQPSLNIHNTEDSKSFSSVQHYCIDLSAQELFENLKIANRVAIKGLKVFESFAELHLAAVLFPFTLFLTGPYEDIKVVKQAWIKRYLKSPKGFFIREIGIVQDLTIEVVQQSPFLSLSTALFDAVADLNSQSIYPSKDHLYHYLGKHYPEVKTPDVRIIHECLGRLIKDRRLYHNGRGYFILHNEHILNEVIAKKSLSHDISFSNTLPYQVNTMKEFVLESSFNSSSPTDNDSKRLSDCPSVLSNTTLIKGRNGLIYGGGRTSESIKTFGKTLSKHAIKETQNVVSTKHELPRDQNNIKIQTQIKDNISTINNSNNLLSPQQENCLDLRINNVANRPKIQRSHSFSGYETDKSFKTVSFALIGQPKEKDIDSDRSYFKRSRSVGVGHLRRSPKLERNLDSCETKTLSTSTETEKFETPIKIVEPEVENVDEVISSQLASQLFDMQPNELRPLDVLNHYNDLGSCLSLTTKMGLPAYTASDFFPPSKTECLAEELKTAFSEVLDHKNNNYKQNQRIDAFNHKSDSMIEVEKSTSEKENNGTNGYLTSDSEIKNALLSPRSRKKIGGQPYESQYCSDKLEHDNLSNELNNRDNTEHNRDNTEHKIKKEVRKSNKETQSDEPIVVRMRSRTKSTDEKRKTQKQRNSLLFEEKRSSLKLMGMV